MQELGLQSWDSEEMPTQALPLPPNCGEGFVHVRVRSWVPPPHVTEHAPKALH